MICKQCKAILPDKSKFCPLCAGVSGSTVNESPPEHSEESQSSDKSSILEIPGPPKKNRLTWILLAGVAAFLFAKSRGWLPGSSDSVSFSGKWVISVEAPNLSFPEQTFVNVAVQNNKFSLIKKTANSEISEIYDGKTLYTRSVYLISPQGQNLPPSGSTAQDASYFDTEPKRFWKKRKLGKKSVGELIAGHKTVLHEFRDARPSGEIVNEVWEDADTGVILKAVESAVSSQASQPPATTTWECQEIHYGPVDSSLFSGL